MTAIDDTVKARPIRVEAPRKDAETRMPRVPQLDGLRGAAAVTVLFLHLLLAYRYRTKVWFLVPFFSGSQAVILFFVLSGYVLSLPFWAGRARSYGVFVVRRFVRIYVPFFVAAVLSIAAAYLFRHSPLLLTAWFNETWKSPITLGSIVAQLFMWPVPVFNTALWSLRYEMQVSLVFPLLLLVMRRFNPLAVTAVVTAAVFVRPERMLLLLHWHLIGRTLGVACLFMMGACAAWHHTPVARLLKENAPLRWCLAGVALYLYCSALAPTHPDRSWVRCALGSVGLIYVALSSRTAERVLDSLPLQYLGRVSYSLYLTHSVVLFGLTDLLYGHVPLPVLVGLIVLGSFSLAQVFYRLVEKPSIEWARQWTTPRAIAAQAPGTQQQPAEPRHAAAA